MPQVEFHCEFNRQWVQQGLERPRFADGVLDLNSLNSTDISNRTVTDRRPEVVVHSGDLV
jgi:hypothetical protein